MCGIYIIIIISCTGFRNWFYAAPKASLTCLTFQCFFSFFFLGLKLEGCRLPLQLQNQQERFQMPSGSHTLASCHVLYDISIFIVLPEWERQKEKQRKTGAILAQQQWAAATCGSKSFCGVMGYTVCQYIIAGLSFLWHNPARRPMWSEVKTVSNGSLYFHPVYIGQIFESIVIG